MVKYEPVARDPRLRENQRCGVCGRVETLTKAHVPPQAAGNKGANVRRSHFVRIDDGQAVRSGDSRPVDGGMWVYGHCQACNLLASKFDPAYSELCRAVARGEQGGRYFFTPPVPVEPGAVARSVLMGMCALTPQVREVDRRLVTSLEHGDSMIEPPERMRLYVCRTTGSRGRVSGPIAMFMPTLPSAPTGQHWGMSVMAQIWFPPIAWVLAHPDQMNSYLNVLRWADVTSWISTPVGHREPLSRLVPRLPVVLYPRDSDSLSDHAVELFSDEVTHYMRCDLPADLEDQLVR